MQANKRRPRAAAMKSGERERHGHEASSRRLRTIEGMDLPPGPSAPAAWRTVAWMARPGAFMQGLHQRFGDPVTIRTYWTEEPMVLFSGPAAVRDIFRLDPAIAPAGRSWEFLR